MSAECGSVSHWCEQAPTQVACSALTRTHANALAQSASPHTRTQPNEPEKSASPHATNARTHTRAACAHATGSRRARTLVFHLKAGCRPLTFSVRHAGARVQRTKVWQNKCIQRCARGRIRTWAHQRWPLGMRPWPPFSCAPCAWQNKVHTEMRPWPPLTCSWSHQVQMYQSFFLLYHAVYKYSLRLQVHAVYK